MRGFQIRRSRASAAKSTPRARLVARLLATMRALHAEPTRKAAPSTLPGDA